ncbi:adenosylcobinamide-GDP ribazoletransferase [Planktotalea sp.]|uniref:adenosylcobinamide-GDP ribazoletransferase n=1 Tax=Planktotalea sp. TaxID=2029877 RepID=UPI003C76D34D
MKLQNDFFRDALVALSLLTRLPIKLGEPDYQRSAQAAWAYPLVGIATGAIACIAAALALLLGLPLWCVALLSLGAGAIVTGAMHEDGLADCADGFWGGWDPAMRLKIMKDSQIGTYGVLALLVTQGIRFGAVLEILSWESWVLPLIAVHVASRAVMPTVMHALPPAREAGLSHSVGRVSFEAALKAVAIGVFALLIGLGLQGIFASVIAALALLGALRLAKAKIGGQTGDVCGAVQQVTEVALLITLLAG